MAPRFSVSKIRHRVGDPKLGLEVRKRLQALRMDLSPGHLPTENFDFQSVGTGDSFSSATPQRTGSEAGRFLRLDWARPPRQAIVPSQTTDVRTVEVPKGLAGVDAHQSVTITTHPDRYLDGQALANRLTPWLLARWNRETLRSSQGGASAVHLYMGYPTSHLTREAYDALEGWLLSHPDGAVTPEAFLKKAIDVAGGRIKLGLTYCWDMMQMLDEANGKPTWLNAARNALPISQKLFDITGEREWNTKLNLDERNSKRMEMFFGLAPKRTARGDNYSSWYHFFGVALASFKNASQSTPWLGQAVAKFMVNMEEEILFPIHMDPLKRKNIDLAGASFGAQLAQNLTAFHSPRDFHHSSAADQTSYLYDNPEVYGRRWALAPNELPHEFPARFAGQFGAVFQKEPKESE